jgi:hypothetical protein
MTTTPTITPAMPATAPVNGKCCVTKQCDRCGLADTGHPSGMCAPCRRKLAERFKAELARRAAEIKRGSFPAPTLGAPISTTTLEAKR